jgi:hypothetical protein
VVFSGSVRINSLRPTLLFLEVKDEVDPAFGQLFVGDTLAVIAQSFAMSWSALAKTTLDGRVPSMGAPSWKRIVGVSQGA